ncbi:hypothetical protein MM239_01870 [Belliella sp. DSM 111904]|uniref:Uncharacterized protein n=1 Tax=Belliella filtrata TaxID=2923435 RepID=A0ABS9UWD9_9BACT|nr:hypothetical protein [Belliella filtrata]MCH7408128.1 hypothetical protein [Belliella filtrata]
MSKYLWAKSLKKEFDHLIDLKEKDYELLIPYIKIRSYKRGTIIRDVGELEPFARYVSKGWIAKKWPADTGRDYRVRVFGPGKIASDMNAFFSGEKSNFYMKAITYVNTFELKKNVEDNLLQNLPTFKDLASKLVRISLEDAVAWQRLSELPLDEGLKQLKSHYSDEMMYFSNKDLAYIFKTTQTNIANRKKEVF